MVCKKQISLEQSKAGRNKENGSSVSVCSAGGSAPDEERVRSAEGVIGYTGGGSDRESSGDVNGHGDCAASQRVPEDIYARYGRQGAGRRARRPGSGVSQGGRG